MVVKEVELDYCTGHQYAAPQKTTRLHTFGFFCPMTQEFYIISAKGRAGPYDLVAVVRKIRNGSLTSNTQLQLGDSAQTKPACEWPELAEFFGEKKDERPAVAERAAATRTLSTALQSGMHFLQRNQYSTVYAGLLVMLIILIAAFVNFGLPAGLHAFCFMACFVLGHFLVSCYMLSVLRMARGQPIDAAYMQSKIGPALGSLMIASLFVCVPAIFGLALLTSSLPVAVLLIGLLILVVPGLFTLSLYAYTPLLILDKGCDFWEGMEMSRKAVLKGGMEQSGIIYALFVINFLAGLCVFFPMALTLPITMGALADMYDEVFS
jgi:hypothetical protein